MSRRLSTIESLYELNEERSNILIKAGKIEYLRTELVGLRLTENTKPHNHDNKCIENVLTNKSGLMSKTRIWSHLIAPNNHKYFNAHFFT